MLTIDNDWAPDCAIDTVAQVLRENRIKTTWFVTHMSPAIEHLRDEPELFELGIHPNFLPDSTHGPDIHAVLEHMNSILPDATSMRSHSLVQSGPIMDSVTTDTSITVDSSIFLPEMANIVPVNYLTPHGRLTRVPFFWADDYEMMKAKSNWHLERYKDVAGVKVLMFHPIHIALNSNDVNSYSHVKASLEDLNNTTADQLAELISNSEEGIHTCFDEIIAYMKNAGICGRFMREFTLNG